MSERKGTEDEFPLDGLERVWNMEPDINKPVSLPFVMGPRAGVFGMLQAFATLSFLAIAVGAVAIMGRLLSQDWDAVCTALGLKKASEGFAPLPPRYRVNSRRTTFVRMEAAPLRRAA